MLGREVTLPSGKTEKLEVSAELVFIDILSASRL